MCIRDSCRLEPDAAAFGVAAKRPELSPKQQHHREDRAQLDDDLKHRIEALRDAGERQDLFEQDHVSRAADRQPFCNALDDAVQRLSLIHI